MNFSVASNVSKKLDFDEIKVGVVPGRFDAKAVILTALAILYYQSMNKDIIILRTIDKEQLSKCSSFITDGFAYKFPNIPSYNNVGRVWNKYGEKISQLIDSSSDTSLTARYAKEKICQIEKFDILLEYNTAALSTEDENKKFEKAVKSALSMIKEIIKSSALQAKSYYSILSYIEECEGDTLYIPINMKAKDIVCEKAPNIKWIITKEAEGIFLIESTNKDVDIRSVVKDRQEVIYAGRFFCKVTSHEVAKSLIDVIENKIKKIA